jgi:hypothetical protein
MTERIEVREGVFHYVEHYDSIGVYFRTAYPTAAETKRTTKRYRKNQSEAAYMPAGHSVRSVTEEVTRKILD